jgi:hypothetical protein
MGEEGVHKTLRRVCTQAERAIGWGYQMLVRSPFLCSCDAFVFLLYRAFSCRVAQVVGNAPFPSRVTIYGVLTDFEVRSGIVVKVGKCGKVRSISAACQLHLACNVNACCGAQRMERPNSFVQSSCVECPRRHCCHPSSIKPSTFHIFPVSPGVLKW